MKIFILNIIGHSLEDGENSVSQFAGFSKQDCLNQAYENYSDYQIKDLDEDQLPITEDILFKVLGEYGESWNKSYQDLDWTQLEVSETTVKILPND